MTPDRLSSPLMFALTEATADSVVRNSSITEPIMTCDVSVCGAAVSALDEGPVAAFGIVSPTASDYLCSS